MHFNGYVKLICFSLTKLSHNKDRINFVGSEVMDPIFEVLVKNNFITDLLKLGIVNENGH